MSFIKMCNRCHKNERHVAKEKTGEKGDYCLGCKRINKPDKKIKINRLEKLNEFKRKLYALLDEYGFVDTIKINWRNPKDAEDNF